VHRESVRISPATTRQRGGQHRTQTVKESLKREKKGPPIIPRSHWTIRDAKNGLVRETPANKNLTRNLDQFGEGKGSQNPPSGKGPSSEKLKTPWGHKQTMDHRLELGGKPEGGKVVCKRTIVKKKKKRTELGSETSDASKGGAFQGGEGRKKNGSVTGRGKQ